MPCAAGRAGFRHELNLPVGEVTLAKLHPGLVIEVHCDKHRRRVVPTVPLKVPGG